MLKKHLKPPEHRLGITDGKKLVSEKKNQDIFQYTIQPFKWRGCPFFVHGTEIGLPQFSCMFLSMLP